MSNQSINVVFDDGVVAVRSENPLFEKVRDALNSFDFEKVTQLVDVANRLKKTSDERMYVVDGIIYITNPDGSPEAVPNSLSTRIISFLDENLDVEPLYLFWQNLRENPSEDSKQDLFGFLDANRVPVTADGCFIAYKRVRDDYTDLQTGKFDNHPGKLVQMDRDKVDPNREQTCSTGLHVAAFIYAKDFYANGHLLEVKVNPKNVVAVPTDYNQQKMRVCEYEVIRECGGPREEQLYTDDDSYNEEEAYIEEDEETEETEGPRGEEMVYNVDGKGRLCIPSILVKEIGLTPGKDAWVEMHDNEIYIYNPKTAPSDIKVDRVYKVDKDCNIRLAGSVLENLEIAKDFYIVVTGNCIVIN
jgi:hypothetical protein